MEVILLDDVIGLGDIGETIRVKPGYARNYLVPRGLALESGSVSAKVLAHRTKQIEAKKKKLRELASTRSNEISGFHLDIEIRVGANGRTFGSVTARDIAEKLTEKGFITDRRRVLLTEPIRKLGEHPVSIKIHQDIEATVIINVVAKTDESAKDSTAQSEKNA